MKIILRNLLENKLILDSEVDVYSYGLKIILLKLIHYFFILLISFFYDIPFETIVFLYSYSIIRTNIGGIHASNPYICLCLSILFIVGLKSILYLNFNLIMIDLFIIIISFYFYLIQNKSLSSLVFFINLFIINIYSAISVFLNVSFNLNCIFYGYILNLILYKIGKYKI